MSDEAFERENKRQEEDYVKEQKLLKERPNGYDAIQRQLVLTPSKSLSFPPEVFGKERISDDPKEERLDKAILNCGRFPSTDEWLKRRFAENDREFGSPVILEPDDWKFFIKTHQEDAVAEDSQIRDNGQGG